MYKKRIDLAYHTQIGFIKPITNQLTELDVSQKNNLNTIGLDYPFIFLVVFLEFQQASFVHRVLS